MLGESEVKGKELKEGLICLLWLDVKCVRGDGLRGGREEDVLYTLHMTSKRIDN